MRRNLSAMLAVAMTAALTLPAAAGNVIDDWATIKRRRRRR